MKKFIGGITMSILNAVNLKKYYGKNENLVKALDDVSVSIENGEFIEIGRASCRERVWYLV